MNIKREIANFGKKIFIISPSWSYKDLGTPIYKIEDSTHVLTKKEQSILNKKMH